MTTLRGPLPPPASDVRLKTDIRQVGTTVHSLPDAFRYIGKEDLDEGAQRHRTCSR